MSEHASETAGQRRTALASLVAAAILVALKLGTGLATGSLALVSAGVESSGDVIAALLTLLAVRFGLRPADASHHYGHRRAENLAALGEAALVAFGALVITYEAVGRLGSGGGEEVDTGPYVFAVIAVAIAIDASRIVISLRAARRYRSAAFRSNAFNFAGDLAGSIAVLVGLALVAGGVPSGDAVAALLVAGLIFAGAGRLVAENVGALMDQAPAAARVRAEQALDGLHPPVEVRRLRLRESGGRIFADVTVGLPPAAALVESHDAADRIEGALRAALPGSDVVVHTEPTDRDVTLRERVLAAALAEPDVYEVHDVGIFDHEGETVVALHVKLTDELPLRRAHEVAARVEAAILGAGGVDAVHTHLEPLERRIASLPLREAEIERRREDVAGLVRRLTGRDPLLVRIVAGDRGMVILLTVELDEGASLTAAHDLTGELEEAVRGAHPDVVDVVIHTEPRG